MLKAKDSTIEDFQKILGPVLTNAGWNGRTFSPNDPIEEWIAWTPDESGCIWIEDDGQIIIGDKDGYEIFAISPEIARDLADKAEQKLK